jgi:hypothetical protein
VADREAIIAQKIDEIATLKAHIDDMATVNAQKIDEIATLNDEIATLNDEIATLKAQLAEVILVQGVAAAEQAARAVDKQEVEALCVGGCGWVGGWVGGYVRVCVCVCMCVCVCTWRYVCMYIYT